MRTIDAHAHTIARELTRDFGDEPWRPTIERVERGQLVRNQWTTDGPAPREITDVKSIMEDMEEMRIDMMAVCTPNYLCPYHLPSQDGLHAAQVQNDAVARLTHDYPGRFAGLGVVPMQDVDLAVKELRRIKDELKLFGIGIMSNVQGVHLGDTRFEPFWEAVADLDMFVFIHPSLYKENMSPTLKKYALGNTVGMVTDTALNAADMVFSGVLERHPGLKVLLAHAGGSMPWLMFRCQHAYEKKPEARIILKSDPVDSVKKFYFDTITHDKKTLTYLVETFGADHVLLGSDFPWDMGPDWPVPEVENLDIPEADKAKILGGNAARLMGIKPD